MHNSAIQQRNTTIHSTLDKQSCGVSRSCCAAPQRLCLTRRRQDMHNSAACCVFQLTPCSETAATLQAASRR